MEANLLIKIPPSNELLGNSPSSLNEASLGSRLAHFQACLENLRDALLAL